MKKTISFPGGNVLLFTLFVSLLLSLTVVFFMRSKRTTIEILDSYITSNQQATLSSSWVSYFSDVFSKNISHFTDGSRPAEGLYQTLNVPWATDAYEIPSTSSSYLGQVVFHYDDPLGKDAKIMPYTPQINYRYSDAKLVRTCLSATPRDCIRLGGKNDSSPGTVFRSDIYMRIFDRYNQPLYFINDMYYRYTTSNATIQFLNMVMPLLRPLFQMAYDPLNYNEIISGSVKCKYLYQYFQGATVYDAYPETGSCGLIIAPPLNGVSDVLLGASDITRYFRGYGIFQERSPAALVRSHLRPYTMGLIFYLPPGNPLSSEGFLLLDVSVHADDSSYFAPRIELHCYTYAVSIGGCVQMTTVSDRFSAMMQKVQESY